VKDADASRHKAFVTDSRGHFCERYAADVLRWVIRLGGPHVQAEDVAQDVFAVALRRLDTFRGDSSERTWLFGLTRNVVNNARRRAALRRFVGLDSLPEPPSPAPGPADELEASERRLVVRRALSKLKTHHREALVLVDMEGYTAREAGEMLHVPEGTINSRLHHARKAFAAALRREGIE